VDHFFDETDIAGLARAAEVLEIAVAVDGEKVVEHCAPMWVAKTPDAKERLASSHHPACKKARSFAVTAIAAIAYISAPCWTRTNNLLIKSQLLCQLS
jgi:hypothetical protein